MIAAVGISANSSAHAHAFTSSSDAPRSAYFESGNPSAMRLKTPIQSSTRSIILVFSGDFAEKFAALGGGALEGGLGF